MIRAKGPSRDRKSAELGLSRCMLKTLRTSKGHLNPPVVLVDRREPAGSA